MFTPSRRAVTLICLWVSFAGGFFFWRSSTFLVWCDSPIIATNLFEESSPLLWSDSNKLTPILRDSFGSIGASGYRPLSHMILLAGMAFFSDPKSDPNIWYAAVGALIGLLAACCFLVSRRFLQSDGAAFLAVFLFLFSTPVVTGAWNVFCGIQVLVPLLVCIGLLLYWKAVEGPRLNWLYVAGLCIVFFVGPWFREFIGFLPLLIIFLEAQRARRPTLLMGLAGLFFLHAIYPMAIVKFIFYPDLPIKPVFNMGHLGAHTSINEESASLFSRLVSNIRWEVPLHFLTLYPPILFALVLLGLLLPLIQLSSVFIRSSVVATEGSLHVQRPWEIFVAAMVLVATVAGLLAVYYESSARLWFILGLCLSLGPLALYRNVFLGWWFCLFFLPFFRVFTGQVHLAYSLLPATIIIVAALENCWRSLRATGESLAILRYSFAFLCMVAFGDHILNPYNSYGVVKASNNGILKMADWFRSHVPKGSIVVTNALHGEDIRLLSNGHIKVLWTVQAGIARDKDALANPRQLEELVKQVHGKTEVYFLDMDFNYTPVKFNYHAHKYVRNRSVAMETMGLVHTTRVIYPYLDPFKAFVPRSYISFIGPPDLENDFYRGPAQNGMPLLREIYVEYHVYKVTGTKVDLWDPNGPANIVKAGYGGFNIFQLNGRYFAIPQGEHFDLREAMEKKYSRTYESDRYDKITAQIDSGG